MPGKESGMLNQKGGMSRGCMVTLIVVGVIAVLVIASLLICYIYREEIVELGLTKLADTVAMEAKNNLPEGVTAEDIDNALDEFKKAFKEKKIDTEEIQSLSMMFQDIMKDKEVDADEVEEFIDEIKKAAK